MKLYRYSPVENKEEFLSAVEYIAGAVNELVTKVVGKAYPLTYLTIFAHYDSEYDRLVDILESLGEVSSAKNGSKVTLPEPVAGVLEIRVRRPDPYRMQVGCADVDVGDYHEFKKTHLENSQNLRCIERPEYEMIEFFDPDTDVLAYIVSD